VVYARAAPHLEGEEANTMRVEIRGRRTLVSAAFREHALRRIGFALSRYGAALSRVVLRVADENGPRGGVDKQARMLARLRRGGQLEIAERDADLYAAIDRGAGRLQRALARALDRRRERGARRHRLSLRLVKAHT
jgi:ribosomal subunit interface protein